MDHDFWHAKWTRNEIGFHLDEVNPLLTQHFSALKLPPGSRVFLPLCGKTRDILWLLDQGYRVVGAELSPLAVNQLFAELKIAPSITDLGKYQRYSTEDLDIWVGDIFDLTADDLSVVDAIYDRAALVALPEAMRVRYAEHLTALTSHAPQLLITFEYDQSRMSGPPFSIPDEEVHRHYANHYQLNALDRCEVAGGLKGKCPAIEHVWLASHHDKRNAGAS